MEVLEYPELGMEAVWKIEVEDFPRSSSWTTKGTTPQEVLVTRTRRQSEGFFSRA